MPMLPLSARITLSATEEIAHRSIERSWSLMGVIEVGSSDSGLLSIYGSAEAMRLLSAAALAAATDIEAAWAAQSVEPAPANLRAVPDREV